MSQRRRQKSSESKALSLRVIAMHEKSKAMFAIVCRHCVDGLPSDVAELQEHELLDLVPVHAHQFAAIEGRPEALRRAVVRLDSLLGLSVKRIGREGGEHSGRVTAIRGAVKLRLRRGDSRICNGLVEITFDEYVAQLERRNGKRKRTPSLCKADAGALVVSWNGDAVGIIVAGSKRRAFVVPLSPFLEREHMVLGIPKTGKDSAQTRSRERDQLRMGLQAYVEELAREPELELSGITESSA